MYATNFAALPLTHSKRSDASPLLLPSLCLAFGLRFAALHCRLSLALRLSLRLFLSPSLRIEFLSFFLLQLEVVNVVSALIVCLKKQREGEREREKEENCGKECRLKVKSAVADSMDISRSCLWLKLCFFFSFLFVSS